MYLHENLLLLSTLEVSPRNVNVYPIHCSDFEVHLSSFENLIFQLVAFFQDFDATMVVTAQLSQTDQLHCAV